MNAIERAMETLSEDQLLFIEDAEQAENIVRRVLREELENSAGNTMTKEEAKGWRKCLRFLGILEGE